MKQATAGTPYRVPPEPRRWSAIVLAVAMHALLLAFLVVGIHWNNSKPTAIEAEVWDMKVQTAAPPPPPPPQAVEPQPEPEPAPPPKVVEAPPPPAPDIKLEQEKKRKEELKQKQLAEEKARKEEEEARKLAEKKEAEKKAREEQKAKELAEKKAAEEKAKAEKAAAKARLAKLKQMSRQQELERITAQADRGTSGSAAKSTAPKLDSGYIAAITAKIKSNTIYPGSTDVPGNPTASFQVEQLPTGDILSVKMIKSSGVPAFDRAVAAGIDKSSPLPHKKDGTVERTLVVNFSMKDMH